MYNNDNQNQGRTMEGFQGFQETLFYWVCLSQCLKVQD